MDRHSLVLPVPFLKRGIFLDKCRSKKPIIHGSRFLIYIKSGTYIYVPDKMKWNLGSMVSEFLSSGYIYINSTPYVYTSITCIFGIMHMHIYKDPSTCEILFWPDWPGQVLALTYLASRYHILQLLLHQNRWNSIKICRFSFKVKIMKF